MRWDTFKCRQCGACCRQPGFVYLKEGEADAAAMFLKMDAFRFVNDFCEVVDRKLVLKKNPDESCVFLLDNQCSIHDAKPRQCKDFPVKWNTPKSFSYCEGIRLMSPEGP